jgi:hypothetical protein
MRANAMSSNLAALTLPLHISAAKPSPSWRDWPVNKGMARSSQGRDAPIVVVACQ